MYPVIPFFNMCAWFRPLGKDMLTEATGSSQFQSRYLGTSNPLSERILYLREFFVLSPPPWKLNSYKRVFFFPLGRKPYTVTEYILKGMTKLWVPWEKKKCTREVCCGVEGKNTVALQRVNQQWTGNLQILAPAPFKIYWFNKYLLSGSILQVIC